MSPETRAFLDGVRHAEDPTPEDERRVLSSVHTALAAGAAGVGVGTTASSAAAANGKLQLVLGTGLKLAGVTAGVAAVAWAVGLGPFSSDTPEAPASTVRRAKPASSALHEALASSVSAPVPPAPPTPSTVMSSEPQKRVARSLVPQVASLREEIALLGEVARALDRGDGASALGRLDAHVTGDRQLLAERKAARIRALCLLGRVEEARAAAVDFRHAHPTSVQRDGIDRSCAGRSE